MTLHPDQFRAALNPLIGGAMKPKPVPSWTKDWDGWVKHLEERAAGTWMTTDVHDYGQGPGKVQN